MTQPNEQITNTVAETLARNIMTKDVLTVYEGWSIKRLSDFFVKHEISGAPVIASDHALVGVVSITDIVRFESLPQEDKVSLLADYVYPEFLGQNADKATLAELSNHADKNCTVNSIMTKQVVSVDEDASLPEIAKLMSQQKIRRIFVTKDGIITGVISTGNILACLAKLA